MFAGSAASRIHCDDAEELIERGRPGLDALRRERRRGAAFLLAANDGAFRMIWTSAPPGTLSTTFVDVRRDAVEERAEDAAEALADVAELREVERNGGAEVCVDELEAEALRRRGRALQHRRRAARGRSPAGGSCRASRRSS